ncbi:MarR family transcriptional regulator, partial [Mycobacterium tuberculosis]|nr:MarR family transcriptional regulator [Mycobacterium tuberculosis]
DDAGEALALDLTELSGALGYLLRRAQLAVFEDFNARFAALELTPAQYSVLLVIGLNPGRKQSEIARVLGIQRANFVVMLDHLQR